MQSVGSIIGRWRNKISVRCTADRLSAARGRFITWPTLIDGHRCLTGIVSDTRLCGASAVAREGLGADVLSNAAIRFDGFFIFRPPGPHPAGSSPKARWRRLEVF